MKRVKWCTVLFHVAAMKFDIECISTDAICTLESNIAVNCYELMSDKTVHS